jgi:hypothetical protein
MFHSKSSNSHVSYPSKHVKFDLSPSKSFYKAPFQGTQLGEIIKKMLLYKTVQEGLKPL